MRFVGALAATLLLLGASSAPLFAQDGGGSGSSGSGSSGSGSDSSQSSTDTSGSSSSDSSTETETQTETELHNRQDVKSGATQLLDKHKGKAASDIAALRSQKGSSHSAADLQKACSTHKDSITAKAKRFATNAAHHEATFDTIFTKVQTFYTDKQLTVADYDTQLAAVKAKQTVSASDVVALQTLSTQTIDCTDQNAAALYVSQLKTAVTTAKDDLKAYRTALVSFIQAVRSAAGTAVKPTTTNDTTTGGQ